ncbi:MAG TPA: FkbM family methyltransferase [Pseudolabrys sp.]|jgi:FkbM family methyltransferase
MDLSYTQNMEDTHLWLAFGRRHHGTYIDIGAGHPIADNVSFFFYERGWQGVAVEPQQRLIDLYARVRPRDVAVAALIGTRSGPADFHVFDAFHGLSTSSAVHADAAAALGAGYRTIQVPMMPLAELCRAQGLDEIDFLKIDVEGTETDVLKSADWKAYRPKAVVVEAIAPGSNEPSWQEWEPFLLAQGYRFMLFDTLNRFYVAEEAKDVAARFPRERAPWDSVRHMYEIGRAPENKLHPEHALARILGKGFWASLPYLETRQLAVLLERARTPANTAAVDAALQVLDTEDFRARLGRIACGYDGGQIYNEDEGAR